MKALITGSEGFAGKYLSAELIAHGYSVTGLDLIESKITRKVDLRDAEATKAVIQEEAPDCIFHLAALADVGRTWKEPKLTFELNVIAAVNLMEAVRNSCKKAARMVMIGSSDQYGSLGSDGNSVHEGMEMKPMSIYAVSKCTQEELAQLYSRVYGLQICMTRSFNHGGAGQRTGFMIPDFASGIVRIERGEQRELLVGNLSAQRDFTHIKDVVSAYRLIAEKGIAGEVYNVGSGKTYSALEVLNRLRRMASCEIPIRQDPSRMRPSDTPIVCCDHSKLTMDTGWEPIHSLDDILEDTLAYYRAIGARK